MKPRTTAEEACGLLDSVLNTISDIVHALRSFGPAQILQLPQPEPKEDAPVFRQSALIPLSALMEAQELSRKPKRRKKRGRRQKSVEVIYRRPVGLRLAG